MTQPLLVARALLVLIAAAVVLELASNSRSPFLFLGEPSFVADTTTTTTTSDVLWSDYSEEAMMWSAEAMTWSTEAMLLRNVSSVFEYPEMMWPQSHHTKCTFNVTFYVYNDLPRNFTTVFEHKLQEMANNNTRISENLATEWALLQLFRTSPCRVYNASETQLFFVPYMHRTHCTFAEGYAYGCGQVPDADMNAIFASLQYYSPTTRHRHIFLNVYDAVMTKKQMRRQNTYFKITSGPITEADGPGSIVVPIFHDSPQYQPSNLLKVHNDNNNESWWTRPRKYSFAAFFEARLNPRMKRQQPRRFRVYFVNSIKEYYPDTVGGFPYVVNALSGQQGTIDYTAVYRESVLCPILPGDNCWQRRFFDVIRNGCLPVVMEWPLPGGERSWHTPGACPISKTYPFMKGMFWNDSAIEIDYDSFVVKAPGNLDDETNVSSILTTMEQILADPLDVYRRQRNMAALTPAFTLGLGLDAHVYDDAFNRIMRILQYSAR